MSAVGHEAGNSAILTDGCSSSVSGLLPRDLCCFHAAFCSGHFVFSCCDSVAAKTTWPLLQTRPEGLATHYIPSVDEHEF